MNSDLAQTYDRIAEHWNNDHAGDGWWTKATAQFTSLLPTGASVLDVGCGTGFAARYMAEHGLHVTGIDISEGQLALARKNAPGAIFKLFAMEDLDSMSTLFDGVFAQASLLHVPRKDAAEMVRKLARRTPPGGYVYVALKEMRPDMPGEMTRKESEYGFEYGFEYERFFSFYTMPELEHYFADAGLEIVWRDSPQFAHTTWLQVIGKKC